MKLDRHAHTVHGAHHHPDWDRAHAPVLDVDPGAVAAMIDHSVATTDLDPAAADAPCSVAVDLEVHEVVDVPNWVVGAWLPKAVVRW